MNSAARLAKVLKNVGPKLAGRMIEAGIDSPEKLRALGAKGAFSRMYRDGVGYGDFNAAYLDALEGAIRDCDWNDIPNEEKEAFKRYAQALQRARKVRR